MFITLTRFHTGERIHLRADKIHTIQPKGQKTLIINDIKGQYVFENDVEIVKTIERILASSFICCKKCELNESNNQYS